MQDGYAQSVRKACKSVILAESPGVELPFFLLLLSYKTSMHSCQLSFAALACLVVNRASLGGNATLEAVL